MPLNISFCYYRILNQNGSFLPSFASFFSSRKGFSIYIIVWFWCQVENEICLNPSLREKVFVCHNWHLLNFQLSKQAIRTSAMLHLFQKPAPISCSIQLGIKQAPSAPALPKAPANRRAKQAGRTPPGARLLLQIRANWLGTAGRVALTAPLFLLPAWDWRGQACPHHPYCSCSVGSSTPETEEF